MINRGTLFLNIIAFIFVGILSLPANAEGLEKFSKELDFSSTKVFFETLTKALSSEALPQKLSETEVSAAVKIFKKVEIRKNFDTLVDLSEAQPTSAQTIIYNVKEFGSKVSENDLGAFKSHLFELAVAEAQKKDTLEDVYSSPLAIGLVSTAIMVVAGKKSNKPSCKPDLELTVSLASSASTIAENAGSPLTLTATLLGVTNEAVTVSIATSGTATEGTDYGTVSDITISAGSTTGTTSFTPTDDSTYEGDETATLAISGVSGGGASENCTQTTAITITDNESVPTVDFNSTSSTGAESVSSKALTVDLSVASVQNVTVNYAITGTATGSGTDYTLADGTLTIYAGSTSGTITIASIINDTLDEVDETVIVTLSGAGNSTLGSDSAHTYTITDNDNAPSLSIVDVATLNEAAGNAEVTVRLSTASGKTVTVSYATSDGTATAGSDYTAISATTLTFSPGDTSKTINIAVLADTTIENNETVTITLSSASNATISDATGTLTITDDDRPSLSINDVTTANENAANATFTVTLSVASASTVTVNYATSNGTATAGSDYTAVSATTLTFSAGETSKTFTVGVLADSLDEDNETVTLTLSSVNSNATISDATGILTITDDDAAPSLSINDVTTSNENAANATFTVTLSAASSKTVTVNYATSDGTATAGSDYTAVSATTLTFSPGDTSKTFNVAVLADSLDEANETATLTLSSVNSNATISDATGTLTIADDDATPSLSINDVTTSNENAANATFTVTLSAASSKTVTVNYATSNGTATAGSDYTAVSATTLTFSAGETSKTFTVGVLADSLDEANETATLTLTSASNATISDATGTLTIADDDAAPSLSINDVTTSNENAANATFTVTLSAASSKTVTVNYATSNGTATAGSDYTAVSATTLTFSAGQTSKTFNVAVLADSLDEANETVTLTLSSASNATISDATGTLTITDDEGTPSLTINDVTTANENAANATFTVTLSVASASTVTVNYATSNGTATAGSDYTAVSATTLTFSPGDTTKTFTVGVLADDLDEANETATLTLSSASNASISDATGTLTITDDDGTPSLSINDVTTANESAANATFTVTLSAASSKAVTVNYATSNGTATAGSDYTAVSATTLTFSAGQTSKTFNVAVLSDNLDEANETATLTLSSASNASISDATGTLTITDDDAAPSLSINDVTAAEVAGSSATATFTVTLSAVSGKTVTVNYATSNGTATAGSDYTAVSATTLTFSAGDTTKTFNVTVLADTSYEISETATLTLSSASNATISDATGTLTITDKALNSGYAPLTSSQETTANNYKATTEFSNINTNVWGSGYASHYSTTNEFELINVHKAWAYGLTGAGTTVLVSDSNFDTDSNSLNSVSGKITTSGSISECSNTAIACHGAAISGLIAGDRGDGGPVGVAPGAKLVLTSSTLSTLTTAYSSSNGKTAVAANHSWGFNDSLIDDEITLKASNGWSSNELFANRNYGSTSSAYVTSVANWVSAMDDFQDHGVIVFSNSNTSSNDNAEITAALPEIFPELEEAFIAAVNIDVGGSTSFGVAGATGYRRWSAPCGDAARYCLSADGSIINVLNSNNRWTYGLIDTDSNGVPDVRNYGTSYVAPMISGAVAIIAEAFPNMSPGNWRDRLLASANNKIGYTELGRRTFGNGVVHGYSHEAGHGLLDIYAALQPITSTSYAQSFYAGSDSKSGLSYALNSSQVTSGQSFGDAISNALSTESTYFYDALDGGFSFSLDQLSKESKPIRLNEVQLENLNIKSVVGSLGERKSQFNRNDVSNQKNYFYPNPYSNSRAVNEFFDTGNSYSLSKQAYAFPFLNSIKGGVGADLGVNIGEGNGYLTASLAHTSSDNVGVAKQRSLIASYKNQMTEAVSYGLMLGYISEGDRFLGMKGSGAFNLNGADSKTSILGTKLNFNLGEGSSLGFMAGVSSSKLNKSRDGLITGIDDVYGNSFSMKYEQYGLNKNDKFSFSLSQPHRTSSGSMDVQIAGLSNSDGTIPYEYKSLGLSPSGRQLDLSLGYDRDFSSLATLSSKLNVTKDSGHSNSSWDDRSLYLGLMKKEMFGADQINVGTIFYDTSDRPSFNLQYKINF